MTLKDRLQSGLIGKDETGSASSYESIQTDAQNSLRKEQREELQATIANIEADLRGLIDVEPCWAHNEPYESPNIADSVEINGKYYPDCPENLLVADRLVTIAAIERYCKGDKE